MTTLQTLKKDIVTQIQKSPAFVSVKVLSEYDGTPFSTPMNKPVLTVGIDKVQIVPAGLGGFWGHTGNDAQHGVWANITLRIDIYVDATQDHTSCHLLFEELCQCLLEQENTITKLWCDSISPTKGSYANQLTVKADLKACLTTSTPTYPIQDFIVKGGISIES